jgi:hypothetical protein
MKRIIYAMLMLIFPSLLSAQYYGERATESSFEQSDLFFKSHYLNTFGLYRFKSIAAGLIDDPFLELSINPANLPKDIKNNLVYLDFRGDRTEPQVTTYYPQRYYVMDDYYYPTVSDPRWFNQTRTEPEPIFSIGVLSYPFKERWKQLFIGGSYQIIHKDEKYYSTPSWIYNSRYGYDAFNEKVADAANVPIQDRYAGQDEMFNSGQLFSAFLGYQLSEKLDLGASLNGVAHSREGSYMNLNNDEYGNVDKSEWMSYQLRDRDQDYNHLDVSGGLRFKFSENSYIGCKIGYLSGNAKQEYSSVDSSAYSYDDKNSTGNWNTSYNRSITQQNWKHNGTNKYGSINLSRQIEGGKLFTFYYRYTKSHVNLTNWSSISDTSNYASEYFWNTDHSYYYSNSFLTDQRTGWGFRKSTLQEALAKLKWNLTSKTTVVLGVFCKREKSEISSTEPVYAERQSLYDYTGSYPYHYFNRLIEDKRLEWQNRSLYWTVQVPIILQFQPHPKFGMTVGINRMLESWKIEDQTIAYFTKRQNTENDVTKETTNFGERYRNPDKRISEDYTDVIAKFDLSVTENMKLNLLINPEFEPAFRVAQWWFGVSFNNIF